MTDQPLITQIFASEEDCPDCGINIDPHHCPFREEIDCDSETLCVCCPFHTQQCADDI